jgi:DNA invertase Pin-like site-specific DNA recombinase
MEIPPRHRARLAIVYVRQSTEAQVRQNEGSRQHQEGQRNHARRYGWPADQIRLIDVDLGRSGTTTDRAGYRQVLELIRAGKVGGLFISAVSRAGRREQAWFDLLDLLQEHDVFLFVDGRLTDPNDPSQTLVTKMEAVIAVRENQLRLENMHKGRLARARAGKAVSPPPTGYVATYETRDGKPVRTGQWEKDTKPGVQAAIDVIFQTFREERSVPRTVRALRRKGIKVPTVSTRACR